jgi:hypothetical protein
VAVPGRFLGIPGKFQLVEHQDAFRGNTALLGVLHELVLLSLFRNPAG